MPGTTYGPRIVGDEEFEAAQKEETEGSGQKYGTRVRGPYNEPGEKHPAAAESLADPDGSGTITISELKAALENSPNLLDTAIENELSDSKPRKGALEHFVRLEEEKEEPRPDVLERLNASLDEHYGEGGESEGSGESDEDTSGEETEGDDGES